MNLDQVEIDIIRPIALRIFKETMKTVTKTTSKEMFSKGFLIGRQFTIADMFIEDEEQKYELVENRTYIKFEKDTLNFLNQMDMFEYFFNGFIDGRLYTLEETGNLNDDDSKFYEFMERYDIK
jgi:hypothetical protein